MADEMWHSMLDGNSELANRRLGSGDTEMTVAVLLSKLVVSCAPFQQHRINGDIITDVTSQQVSIDAGMMSAVYRLDVVFNGTNAQSYCLKEPQIERIEEMTGLDFFPTLCEIHDRECDFYEKLAPEIRGLHVPRVHAFRRLSSEERHGYILCDFIGGGDRGRPVPIEHSLTREQMFVIADQIARLHAFGWAQRERLARGNWSCVNISKNELDPQTPYIKLQREKLVHQNVDPAVLERIDQLDDILSHPTFTDYAIFDAHKAIGLPDMLGHGDMWANNLIFEVDADGNLTNRLLGIVDWQQASAASPVQDLLRVMLMNMDTDARHEHESAVYDHYYERFKLHLLAANVRDGPPYEREAIERATRPYFFYQLLLVIFLTANNFPKPEQKRELEIFTQRLIGALDDAILIRDQFLREWLNNNPH